jgi:hypothetical protein
LCRRSDALGSRQSVGHRGKGDIRVAQGEARKVHPLMYAAAAAFTFYFLIPLLHDNLSWI